MLKREDMLLGTIYYQSFPWVSPMESAYLQTVRQVCQLPGIEALEIAPVKYPEIRKELRNIFADCGTLVSYGAGATLLSEGLNLCDLDEARRSLAIKHTLERVNEAAEIGAPWVTVVSGSDPGPELRQQAYAKLIESLTEVCKGAAKRGIGISMELFDRDLDRKMLSGPSKDAATVAGRVTENASNFGLTIDLSHLPLQFESSADSLTYTSPYLTAIHIGNCVLKDRSHPQWGDKHPPLGIEGGENGFEQVVEFLKACADFNFFDGDKRRPVLIEVRPPTDSESKKVLCDSIKLVQDAWERVT